MAKLFFYYSSMNAGKSANLLQSAHNYRQRGMDVLLLTPMVANRDGVGVIHSRLGIQSPAQVISGVTVVDEKLWANRKKPSAIFIDECQFLTAEQVKGLGRLCDRHNIPVLCYGLRTDFTGELFEGSATLLAIADEIKEIKSICGCGKKATMVIRYGNDGVVERNGEQVQIGGNSVYKSYCRKHWSEEWEKNSP